MVSTVKQTKNTRILWADYAKCFGIIAVVAGHAINDVAGQGLDIAYNAIYWWHMPLFFMIGGFFLKKINFNIKGWRYLLGHKIKPLLIAYLLNGSILIILSHFFRQQSWDYTFAYFGRLIYGGSTLNNYLSVFWYMTTYMLAIFMTTILLSAIKSIWWQFLIAGGLFMLGIAFQDITFFGHTDFPWNAQISLLAVFWMLLGHYLFKVFPKIKWSYKITYAIVASLFFIGLIYLYAQDKLNFVLWLKSSNIQSGFQALIIPPIFCLLVFIICEGLEHLGEFAPLIFIGKHTDTIMFYHRAAFDITTLMVFTNNWYFRIIIGLAVPILLALILQKIKGTPNYMKLQQYLSIHQQQYLKIGMPIVASLMLISLAGVVYLYHQTNQIVKHYTMSSTPTIYMHGWASSIRSEQGLVKTATEQQIATEEMIIHVDHHNQLQIQGHLTGQKNNPIILVQFDNNQVGEVRYAQGLYRIVKYLQQKYNITEFNAVGHSMGAYAWVYYGMHWGANPQLPQVNKMALLAGPYNGILNKGHRNQPTSGKLAKLWTDQSHQNQLQEDGRPKIIHDEYQALLKYKNDFPTNTRVLNIYGNLKDGSQSDGLVTIQSVKSLRYLVSNNAKSYQEFVVNGNTGQHSRLHTDNPNVSHELNNYLWHH